VGSQDGFVSRGCGGESGGQFGFCFLEMHRVVFPDSGVALLFLTGVNKGGGKFL
jgi:hypothetical protein